MASIPTNQEAQTAYQTFVVDGKGQSSPWKELKNQIYLGSEAFVEAMQRKPDGNRRLTETPKTQLRPVLPFTELVYRAMPKDAIRRFSKPSAVAVIICGELVTMLMYITQGSAE